MDRIGIGIGPTNQPLKAADRPRPIEREQIVLDRQHRRRVDGCTGEDPVDQFATFRQAEDLWQRPCGRVALQALDCARTEDDHAMCRFTAQHLLPGESRHIQLLPRQFLRKGRRGRVTNRQTFAVVFDPVAIGNPHAGGGAVPCEDHVVVGVHRRQIDDVAIVGGLDLGVDFQLLHHIGDPARAKAFPGEHLDLARTQQVPHRHLYRAGVGRRHDADLVVCGDAQNLAGAFDGGEELFLADGSAVAATQRRASEFGQIIGGGFGAGARRKTRIGRPRCRLCNSHQCYPSR